MQKATRGEVTVSPSAIMDFAKECEESVERQLNKKRKFSIRMSGLGRPLCQQLLDRQGMKEDMDYNALFRFLFGDLVESVMVLIMEQAEVDIVAKQKPVKLTIAGHEVTGTLDLILRDEMGIEKVWDVKSASEWAFKFKYTGFGGYDKIKEDDPFGYVMQGHLYGEATGLPFGGWIVVNKSSGELAMVEAPTSAALRTVSLATPCRGLPQLSAGARRAVAFPAVETAEVLHRRHLLEAVCK